MGLNDPSTRLTTREDARAFAASLAIDVARVARIVFVGDGSRDEGRQKPSRRSDAKSAGERDESFDEFDECE